MKIGMYTEEEIFKEIANGFLGRSMYDAIFDKIHALITENEQLKKTIEEYSKEEQQRQEDEMMDYLIREEEKFNDYSFLED